jgi:DNA segregation ATPase FtsK/SpoIIIE-like protein
MSSPFGDDFKEDDLDKLDEDKLASEGSPSGSSAMKKADADEEDARPRSSVFGAGVTTSRPGGGGLPGSTSSGISAPSPIRSGGSVQPYNRQPLSGAVTPAGGAKAPESSALSTSAATPPAPPRTPAPPPPVKPEEKEKKKNDTLLKLPFGGKKDDAGAKASTAPAKPEEKEKKGRVLPKLPGIGSRKDDAGAKASTTPNKSEEKKKSSALFKLPFGGKRKKEEAAGKLTPPAGALGGAASPLGETKTGGVPTIPSGGGKPAPKPPVKRKSPLEAIRSSVKNFRLFGGAAAKKTAKPAPKSKGGKPVEVKPISLSLDKRLEILGVVMVISAIMIILSSLSPTKGALTEGVNRFLAQTFGWGAIGIPLAMLPIGIWLIMLRAGDDTPVIDTTRVIGVVLLYLCLLTLFQFIHAADYKVGAGQDYLTVVREIFLPISAELGRGGGRVGGFIYYQLISNLTEIGGFLVLLMTMLVAIMLATNLSLSQIALILIGMWRGFNDARRRWAVRRAAKQAELAEKRRQALAAKQPPELPAPPAPAPPPTPMVKIPIQSSLPPPPSVSAPAPSAPVPAPPMETERSIAITAGGRRVTASLVTGTVNEPEAVKPTDEIKAVGDAPAALPNPPAALPIMPAASAPAQPEKTETDEKDVKKPSLFGGIVGALPTGRGAKPDDAPAAKVEPKPEEKGRGLGGFKLPFGKDKPDAPDAAKAEDAKPTPAPKPTPPAVPAVSVPGYVSPFRASSSAPKPPAPAPSAPPAAPAPVSEPALKRETAPLTAEEKPAAPAPPPAAPRPTPFQSKPLDEPKPTAPAPVSEPALKRETAPLTAEEKPAAPAPPPAAPRPTPFQSKLLDELKPTAPAPVSETALKRETAPLTPEEKPAVPAPAPAAPRPTLFQSKPLDEPKPTAPAPVSEPALKRETAPLTAEEKPAAPAPPPAPRPTPFQSKLLDEPKPTAPAPAAKAPAVLPANGISTLNSGAVGESAAPTDEAQTRAPAPAAVSRPPAPPAVAPPKRTPPLDDDEDDLEDDDELDLKNLRPAQPKGIGPLPRANQPPARVMPYRAPAAPPIKAPDAPKPAALAESKADEKPALLSSGIAASALVKPPFPNNNEEKPAAKAADKLAEPSADAVQPFAAPPARRVPPWEDAPKDAPKPADVKADAPPSAPVSAAPKDAPKPADAKADAPPPAPVSAAPKDAPKPADVKAEAPPPAPLSAPVKATPLAPAKIIEDTLSSFGAPGRVVEVNTGPVITQFGVEPDYIMARGKKQRVKVGAIAALDKDLQLALGAKSIRVEAPVPGKGYVGIEVPNKEPATVRLRDVMESPGFNKIKSPLAIALGQSVSGVPVSADW